MRMKLKSALLGLLCLFIASSVSAQNVNYAGTSVANFLKISPAARNSAMGDAPLSGSGSAADVFFNPAAIAQLDMGSVAFSSMEWLVDTRLTYIAAAYPVQGVGVVALDLYYFGTGDIDETTVGEQDGTGRVFSASDLMLGATYAAKLTDRFGVGLKVKMVHENLSEASATAYGFDIGSTFETNFLNGMMLTANLTNFGGKMQFDGRDLEVLFTVPDSPTGKEVPARLKTDAWELPLLFRFGMETDVLRWQKQRLHLAYQLMDSRDYQERHLIGAEYSYNNFVFLRGGYRINWGESSWTAGLGLNVRVPNMGRVSFDYAVADWGVFDLIHQFTVGFKF